MDELDCSGLFATFDDAVVPSARLTRSMSTATTTPLVPTLGLRSLLVPSKPLPPPLDHPAPLIDSPVRSFSDDHGSILPPLSAQPQSSTFQQVPQLPSYVPNAGGRAGAPFVILPPLPGVGSSNPSLTATQRGELELARQRAERAAAGRASNKGQPMRTAAKRNRREVSVEASSDDGEGGYDSDVDLSKLTPEEQQRIISGQAGTEKDARRLKRLLRNRVSAQQARERKKSHLNQLEDQVKSQQKSIGELQGKLRLAEQQNDALRKIIMSLKRAPDGDAAGLPLVM